MSFAFIDSAYSWQFYWVLVGSGSRQLTSFPFLRRSEIDSLLLD